MIDKEDVNLHLLSGNWRPIETAPTDGTPILGIDENGHIEKCWWETFKHLSEWVTTGGFTSYPNHWMPLPSPPPSQTQVQP